MAESLGPEAIQALELIDKHRRASKNELYRQIIRRESEMALFVDTKSKMVTLREIVERDLGYPVTVKHARLAYLRNNAAGAPMKNLGTPATPPPDAQGQLPCPESRVLLIFISLSYAVLFYLLLSYLF
ncbi:hypothetical protein PGT21_017944 [Puccinia graminis f. sp. tritici]|uniref:Uncharacterized protein n=1 Tax=Puccinia graminis f. sp. tritici TaxID=56615 RepID=A0A5B0Q2U9_PUCGR|nr:hypothetical protein PGT21_017944 [Puccinia graminis f. sp. tritici]